MKDLREVSELYIASCEKCGHRGLQHMEKDHRDESRKRNKVSKIVNCTKCDCKKFVPPKEMKDLFKEYSG
jgi:uncharacterized cysteine cluster protein YcgN (CxxCxxCC family)